MNKKTVLGWTITAEPFADPEVLVDIESPCGKYGGSLAMVEDCGVVEDYDTHTKERRVPERVCRVAQEMERAFMTTLW